AQVVAEPGGAGAREQGFQFFEVVPVEGLGGTDRERDAVLDQPEALVRPREVVHGRAALHHEVFADDLEPVDPGLLWQRVVAEEDRRVVGDAQTNTDAQVRQAEAHLPAELARAGGHGRLTAVQDRRARAPAWMPAGIHAADLERRRPGSD